MRRARPTLARSAHAVALGLALLALALSLRESALFLPFALLAAGSLATPFVEWTSVPASLQGLLPRVHMLALLIAATIAWLSRSLGVLVLPPEAIPLAVAPVLVPVWTAFALAPRAFPAGGTLVSGIVALLAFAGLNPAPSGYGGSRLPFLQGADRNGFAEIYLGLAMLAVLALWAAALGGRGPRWSRRTVVAVAVSCGAAALLATTGIIGLPVAQPHVERAFAAALDQPATGLSGESALGDIGALSVSRRRVLDLQASVPSGGRWRLPSEVFTRFDGRRWTNAGPSERPSRTAARPDPPARTDRRAPGGASEPSSGEPRGRRPPASAASAQTPGTRGRTRPVLLFPGPAPEEAGPFTSNLGSWFRAAAGDEVDSSPPGPAVEVRVTQARVEDWPLMLPRDVVAVTANASHLDLDRFGLVRRPRGLPLRQYGAVLAPVRAAASNPAAGRVHADARELSAEEREESLSLPASVDPRVVSLAASLRPGSSDARQQLEATVHHLRTHYEYSLSPGPFRPNGDPLAEFLFEKKAAYCEYFATAAVVLLRLQGVPARFVKGLSVGEQTDFGGGLHVVRDSDAHAWIEAWIPGEGWVEADPTPPGQFEGARGTPGRWERWMGHARAAASAAWRRLSEGGMLAFLRWAGGAFLSLAGRLVREPAAWLVGAALVAGPGLARRLRVLLQRPSRAARDGALHVPAELRSLVRELERRWAANGRPRPAGRGLLEHATAVETGDSIVRAYYRARFGGEAPGPEELKRLAECLLAGNADPSPTVDGEATRP